MNYSDRDLITATQIAYYDFSEKCRRDYKANQTVRELMLCDSTFKELLDKKHRKALAEGSRYEIIRTQRAISLYNEILYGAGGYGGWIVKDVNNDNKNTGFYACLLETSPDSAIIAFRGSESDNGQFDKDWIEADFALLNSVLTKQQREAEKYMEYIYENFNYHEYALSGHSLGGNLAAHAAVNAPYKMQNRITVCLNADGPGFSDEYLSDESYIYRMKRVSGVMLHYQWSVIGNLLFGIPGEKQTAVKTDREVYNRYDLEALTQKHDTCFLEYDVNGNVLKGETDRFAQSIGRLSREIDDSNKVIGNTLIMILTIFVSASEKQKKRKAENIFRCFTASCIKDTVKAAGTALAAAGMALFGWINPDFFGKIFIPFVSDRISDTAKLVQLAEKEAGKILSDALASVNCSDEIKEGIIGEAGKYICRCISETK